MITEKAAIVVDSKSKCSDAIQDAVRIRVHGQNVILKCNCSSLYTDHGEIF